MTRPSHSSVPANGTTNNHPKTRSLSVDVPFESWLSLRTASMASDMSLKVYLGHFLRFCRPLNPDGSLAEPIPVANGKDVLAS